jgi:hypothetical protein
MQRNKKNLPKYFITYGSGVSIVPPNGDNRHMQDFQIQADQATSLNRYPDVFTAVKQFTEKHMVIHPKILSFGCSTGQEPVTLATEYFPNSEIVGLDT